MFIKKMCFGMAVGLMLTLLMSNSSRADSLDNVVERLAETVKKYVQERQGNKIAISQFAGPKSSAGRKIETDLVKKLKELGVGIDETGVDFDWEIRGQMKIDKGIGFSFVSLQVSMHDPQGAEVKGFRERFEEDTEITRDDVIAKIDNIGQGATPNPPSPTGSNDSPAGNENPGTAPAVTTEDVQQAKDRVQDAGAVIDNPIDVATLTGTTVDLAKPVADATGIDGNANTQTGDSGSSTRTAVINPETQQKAFAAVRQAIQQAVENPTFTSFNASTISASQSSPFRLTVEATSSVQSLSYSPVSIREIRGLAFAQLQEGQLYQVRISNSASFDVGVELMIDGINSLELCDVQEFRDNGKWVIPANSSGVIRGWLRNASTLDKFLITEEPAGVAAELGRIQKIGQITAIIYPTWDIPTDASRELKQSLTPQFQTLVGGGLRGATGKGPTENFSGATKTTTFGTEPLSVITVRYNNPDAPVDLPPAN
ncbi:MAG: hypothetical protein KDA80_08045 [Planctomycetaceae bacterium]|nr:hypothetical protein [Planctomycetaceae bacterium]